MSSQNSESSNQVLKNQHVTLLELLDRVIDKGVVAKGELLLSVADIDLVYLNLGLLLSSVKTVEKAARRGNNGAIGWIDQRPAPVQAYLDALPTEPAGEETPATSPPDELQLATGSSDQPETSQNSSGEPLASAVQPSPANAERNRPLEPKANIDPKSVEQGLAKLVLTLIDLIRKLMEKQAIRRIEDGQLSDEEIEDVGNTFLLLNERIEELKQVFHLTNGDLNLDLGPLGELL